MTKGQRTANSSYPKGAVSYAKDSFVVHQTLVFQIKFCGKSPVLRVAANCFSGASAVCGHSKKTLDKKKKLQKWKGYLIHTNQKDFIL